MMENGARDDRLERIIRFILQIGVAISSVILAIGLFWLFVFGRSAAGDVVLTIGLMILIGTPVTRVAASIVEYAVDRDWVFVALTSIVLLEIIGGVIAALVFHQRL